MYHGNYPQVGYQQGASGATMPTDIFESMVQELTANREELQHLNTKVDMLNNWVASTNQALAATNIELQSVRQTLSTDIRGVKESVGALGSVQRNLLKKMEWKSPGLEMMWKYPRLKMR